MQETVRCPAGFFRVAGKAVSLHQIISCISLFLQEPQNPFDIDVPGAQRGKSVFVQILQVDEGDSVVILFDDLQRISAAGSQMRQMQHKPEPAEEDMPVLRSQLSQWPVQIKLVPVNAPYFDGAKLLIAADCTAYAYANFHQKFIRGHITLVGCPKLDDVDYSEKLTQIIRENNIQSVTVVRMEVPCCGGLERDAKVALQNSGKFIPWQVVTISIDGNILSEL